MGNKVDLFFTDNEIVLQMKVKRRTKGPKMKHVYVNDVAGKVLTENNLMCLTYKSNTLKVT